MPQKKPQTKKLKERRQKLIRDKIKRGDRFHVGMDFMEKLKKNKESRPPRNKKPKK